MQIYYMTIATAVVLSFLSQLRLESNQHPAHHNSDELLVKKNGFFVGMTALVLIVVSGLRWGVGTDYWQYSQNYTGYVQNVWADLLKFDEPGLKIIARVANIVNDDYILMFFLAALVTVGLIVWTISKYSNAFTFSILLYILGGSWHSSFNAVRQFLAVAVLFAGHRYIVERKFFKYALIVFIASMFHISAAITILFYFIPIRKLKWKEMLLLVSIVIVISVSYQYLFQLIESIDGGGSFADSDYASRQINILRIVIPAVPLLVYAFMTDKEQLNKIDYFYINIALLNLAIWIMGYNSAYLARFTLYTEIFTILVYPRILRFDHKYVEIFMKVLVIAAFFLYWYLEVRSVPDLSYYRWVFDRY